jgi:O-antigen/teichoic acid export membrane protein
MVGLVVSLFTFPIFASYLSAIDFGTIGYFNSIKAFLISMFNLGMSNYFLMMYFRQKEKENKKTLFNILFYLSINNLIVVFLSLWVSKFFFQQFNISYSHNPYMAFILLTAFFETYKQFLLQQYRIRKQGGRFFFISALYPILNKALGLMMVVYWRFGAVGRMGGTCLSYVIMGIISLILLKPFVKVDFSFKKFISALKFSYPLVIASYFYMPINSIDKIVLERLKLPEEMGLYSIGMRISGFYLIAITALFKAYEPDIFASIIEFNKKKVIRNALEFTIIILIAFILLQMFMKPIISVLTNNKFNDSLSYARALSFANLILGISLIFNAGLLALKYAKLSAIVTSVMGISSIIIYPVFIKYNGYNGAIFGRIFMSFLTLTIYFIIFINLKKKRYESSIANNL